MPNYHYVQQVGGAEKWKPIPASVRDDYINEHRPEFVTIHAVSKITEELEKEDLDKLTYSGPLNFDFDGKDIETVITKCNILLGKLEALGLNLASVRLYATGGKGFHIEVPAKCFMEKIPKHGTMNLPTIYREIALELFVDTLDLRVYSQRSGRMWRVPGNKRANGLYKVPVTLDEIYSMTPEDYKTLCSSPRSELRVAAPELCVDLAVLYARSAQKVEDKLKSRGKHKRDPQAKAKARMPSVVAMMAGQGIRPDAGFHEIALQVAISASTAGQSEAEMLKACAGLVEFHSGDGNRYNTAAKRREELSRMFAYCDDNPCYEFSVGAVKSLLTHEAPDLDGIAATKEEIAEVIAEAAEAKLAPDGSVEIIPDEFGDTTAGVTLSKFGVYADSEFGKKRICAVSFSDIHLLMSMETGQLNAYEAQVLVNGRPTGRQTMEMDTFSSVQIFNRFCARLGHAMQGSEPHVRGLMMRFVELAKKKGRMRYIAKREGLDVVNIPNHDDIELRTPFSVWADGKGVILDPRIKPGQVDVSFQGYPDPRGKFRADLADAPQLVEWLKEPGNKEAMHETLDNLFNCQRPEALGKLLGWYTASIYRMLFHKAYTPGQFPALHVNGAAGAGKCLRKGTLVIMASGSVKRIEDVVVGDQLLGPDGTPRNVLALGRGQEDMWEVKPVKGEIYYVNGSHILSLKRSYGKSSCKLSDGTVIPEDQQVLNVNLRVFAASSKATQKLFKGYRAGALEFIGEQAALPLDPYWLGCWLGDGDASGPNLHKPECNTTRWWVAHAESLGHHVTRRGTDSCPMWAITRRDTQTAARGSWCNDSNQFRETLADLDLLQNKHIPEAYRLASAADRLKLVAGLLDTDGHLTRGGYDWINKDKQLAEDFTFICRSLGFAAYVRPCRKGIKKLGFVGTYYRVSISGDCDRIPCLDKKAPARQQLKDHLVTGLAFKELGVEDYYGVVLDGDHLFLLGDFTVTHNTSMQVALMSLFYYNQAPKVLTPGSSLFAVQEHMAASASIPLILDEYKPNIMSAELHNKYKLMIRDAYNCRGMAKGGGNRDSDDYRSLHETELSAPLCFIAEAAEDESAVSERVVLVTLVKPASSVSSAWAVRYQAWARNSKHLTILGKWLVAQAVNTASIEGLRNEFDPLYNEARETYLLNASDLKKNLTTEAMANKQNAKERSVYNFTVARFGLMKFRALIDSIYGADEFKSKFDEMDAGIYTRMADLQSATQAEWSKVLSMMSTISHHVDGEAPYALRKGYDYAFVDIGGRDCVEIALRNAYIRYRSYVRNSGQTPLFTGDLSFLHAVKDCSALVDQGVNRTLHVPGIYTFDVNELSRLGVEPFKG